MCDQNKKRRRGRPRGFDEELALEAAMLVFWRNGYQGTSLDDLVTATGASRASLYQVFGDKRELFISSLSLYSSRFTERIDAALKAGGTGKEALEATLNASADRLCSGDAPAGCLRCNSTLELTGLDQVIDEALMNANNLFQDNVRRLVDYAVERDELPKGRVEHLPLYYTGIVNGMVTLARSGASRQDLATVIDTALDAWSDKAHT